MATANGRKPTNPTRRKRASPSGSGIDKSKPRKLVTHQKIRKPAKSSMSVVAQVDELLRTPGPTAREELLQIKLMLHGLNPSAEGERQIAAMVDEFELELQIENKDPVSFENAVCRVRQDVDSLFNTIVDDDIHERFFSPLSNTEVVETRPTLEELEARWMSRWIEGSEDTKRRVDEWGKLIGFVGEYLVSSGT